MPLVPSHTWEQTEAKLTVAVAIKGASRVATDVSATEALLKINSPPYFLAIDLYSDIEEATSTACIGKERILLRLCKKTPGLWPELHAVGDADAILKRRAQSLEKAYEHARRTAQRKVDQKKQWDRDATSQQVQTSSCKTQLIQQHKGRELAAHRLELEEWKDSLTQPATGCDLAEGRSPAVKQLISQQPDRKHYDGRGKKYPNSSYSNNGSASTEAALDEATPGVLWKSDLVSPVPQATAPSLVVSATRAPQPGSASKPSTASPPPRPATAPVHVSFTQLDSGHLPARESCVADSRRQAKRAQDNLDSTDIAERHAPFLKDKADGMYAAGRLEDALSCYSEALQLDPHMALCLANRGACYLQLGHGRLCVADCSAAIEMLTHPNDEPHQDWKHKQGKLLRLYVRRAQGHALMHDVVAAVADYQQALRWDPNNAVMQRDLAQLLYMTTDATPANLRELADAHFKSQNFEDASTMYSALLGLDQLTPEQKLAGRAKRAVCCMALSKFAEAAADCDAGLDLLLPADVSERRQLLMDMTQNALRGAAGATEKPINITYPDPSRTASLARLLSRRAAALAHLKRYKEAIEDASVACKLLKLCNELDEACRLEGDIAHLRSLDVS